MTRPTLPTQRQLMLPLLEELRSQGGAARPRDLYDRIALRIGLSDAERRATAAYAGGRRTNLFERRVRWTRQTAIGKGYMAAPTRSVWELTDGGSHALQNARRGVIVTVFEIECGRAVWANAEDAAAVIDPETCDLLFASPPYPLLRPKQYGNLDTDDWLEWTTELARGWRKLLRPTGSLVLNLGPTFEPGRPVRSPYIERLTLRLIDDLGYRLADRLYWHQPAKLANQQWVAIRRVRVRSSVEPLLWFSKYDHPKADNRNVLTPYAPRTVARDLGRTAQPRRKRPSGFTLGPDAFARDNGGAIPGSLVTATPPSSDHYRRRCRETGVPQHPAVMPQAVAEFAISLTTQPGDLVLDPFFGSGTTGAAAQALGRRFVGIERSLAYLRGAAFRFEQTPGFIPHI